MKNNENHIFIDTNVLIGCYSNIEADKLAITYLYSLKGKRLYTSSLAIAQLVSVFQKIKSNEEIKDIINKIRHKINILSFVEKDIESALTYDNTDIEDNIQYVISNKQKCLYFVTNNKKDYRRFNQIDVIDSTQIRVIRR